MEATENVAGSGDESKRGRANRLIASAVGMAVGSVTLYHPSAPGVSMLRRSDSGIYGPGVYLTSDADVAHLSAPGSASRSAVYECKVENIMVADFRVASNIELAIKGFVEQLGESAPLGGAKSASASKLANNLHSPQYALEVASTELPSEFASYMRTLGMSGFMTVSREWLIFDAKDIRAVGPQDMPRRRGDAP